MSSCCVSRIYVRVLYHAVMLGSKITKLANSLRPILYSTRFQVMYLCVFGNYLLPRFVRFLRCIVCVRATQRLILLHAIQVHLCMFPPHVCIPVHSLQDIFSYGALLLGLALLCAYPSLVYSLHLHLCSLVSLWHLQANKETNHKASTFIGHCYCSRSLTTSCFPLFWTTSVHSTVYQTPASTFYIC